MLVVAGSSETLDALATYLGRAGLSCESRRAANPLADLPASARALVVFPDDFPAHAVGAYLALIGARRPDLALVVVTGNAAAYATMHSTDGRPLNTRVLPRPAFGWAILDAIRAALPPARLV